MPEDSADGQEGLSGEQLAPEDAEAASTSDLFRRLASRPDGLTTEEAERRLALYGPNALEEHRQSALLAFLSYFWGPIPWMIEVAAVLSAIVRHWVDLVIILVLLVFNAGVGFWQEHQAANAVAALKRQLALRARVLRDGGWGMLDAAALVPGDVVRLRLGDVIPADTKLLEGDYLSVDQSALTGESLPVDKRAGDLAYSGSVAKQGEMVALVVSTGSATYFGRTATLVAEAKTASHFQKAVITIGDYLIYLSLFLVAVLVTVQLFRGAPFLSLVQFALILTVAAIPVAMPAVLSVTMALGAVALSKMKAIVSHLESIEEMAGMDVLFSDKTGTLTENRLTLGEPAVFAARDAHDLVLAAALASKEEDADAFDLAVLAGLDGADDLRSYRQRSFVPFDPVRKRTDAEVETPEGRVVTVTKGAPQVVMDLCALEPAVAARASSAVEEFATKGYRTLGVARISEGRTEFLGLLPLFDPPREDSAETIRRAGEHGVEVKMVTGDDVAIAREIAGRLGLGSRIRSAEEAFSRGGDGRALDVADLVEQADGFARVFPEHKFELVRALQARGHIVG